MKNLRVLKIDASHISGDFKLLSKELRWLSWQKCSLKYIPSNFPAEKLVVLDMQGSNIQEFGLNLQKLKRTPNFNGSRSLKTLRFRDCSNLTEIHQSIGSLSRLIYLNLDGCKKLTDLPSSICKLKSLESLKICWCSSLQTLPVGVRDMGGLNTLNAAYAGITQLPVEMPRNLVQLEIRGQHLEAKAGFSRRRVYRVGSLPTCVVSLTLTYCGLSEADFPKDFGSLSFLQILNLSGNSFHHLPFDFSKLRFLKDLRLNDCENLQTLPSVSNLEYLQTFEIANCEKIVKITEFENIPCIRRINMLNCTSLQNPFNEGFFSAHALAFPSRKYLVSLSLSLSRSLAIVIIFHLHLIKQGLEIYLQCDEYKVPDWFNHQVTTSSICFTMPTHNKKYTFLGMFLWCVRSSCPWKGLGFSIAGKMTSRVVLRLDNVTRAEHACVLYRSYLEAPFDGQIKGGEKIELFELGKEKIVKKIGIHLLYLDQHGKVTSLPALVDYSESNEETPCQEINVVSVQ
ncbi:disease resistance protein RUN1-like isoform X2 [Lycium ferocissimum]|uniref:disease resistance protein RUN1-like isoform X2 n=1 Tax=Lycium ferocissimum TaxID=112874 RepID=UPI002814A741|nr:disease resistance protein RUN1-like isoform X2 [Lycium ferocissimum]